MQPREAIRAALTRSAGGSRDPKLVAFLTAGYPKRAEFLDVLRRVARARRTPWRSASRSAIRWPTASRSNARVTARSSKASRCASSSTSSNGVSTSSRAPVLLMSYLNPLLAFGYEALARRAAEVGVCGFIVPDLPYEESAPLRAAFGEHGLRSCSS